MNRTESPERSDSCQSNVPIALRKNRALQLWKMDRSLPPNALQPSKTEVTYVSRAEAYPNF